MAKREGKRQISKKNIRTISCMLLAVTFVIAYFCVLTAALPKHYDVKVGDPSAYTIYAPQNITDETATAALKEAARNAAAVVYELDNAKIDSCVDDANVFFNGLSAVRKQAEMMRGTDVLEPILSEEGWRDLLSAEQKTNLAAMTKPNLNEGQLCAVLAAGVSDIQFLKDLVIPKLQTSLEAGLSEDTLASVKSTCIREVNATTSLTAGLKDVGALLIESYMEPTLVANKNATAQAQEDAAAAVEPVIIQKGDIIIKRGDVLNADQYALLGQLSLVRDGQSNLPLIFGMLFALLAAFALYTVYLFFLREDVFYDTKRMVILTVFTVLVLLVALLCNQVDTRLSPALIAIMLTSLLVCPNTALALTALLSIVMGLMAAGSGKPLIGADSFMMTVSTFASGVAAVFALRKAESRGALVAAGAVGGGAAALAAAALMVLERETFLAVLLSIGYAVGSAMISTLLVVGSLSVWENLFDVATAARLNELSNTNHPLLKQLMLEAPGTYQHCNTVAALAEAAAERIGANTLLARVGALFHDVGKLRRPIYFKENQKSGENIHDSLPPLESAQTIIAHQKDGVTLLTRHKLPSAVIRIAGEHHGNALMTYFYYKAKQAEGGDSVQMKNFRYSGNRPSTKESAIVMLADSCEAAVRSLGDTKKEAMEEMVHKVIYGKMTDNDNMMTNAPLTLAEFTEIEKSFIKTFGGIMHDRIEYPDLEEVNKK